MEMNCASYLKLSVSVQAQLWMPLSALRPVIGLSLERTVCSAPAGGGGVSPRVGHGAPLSLPAASAASLGLQTRFLVWKTSVIMTVFTSRAVARIK